MGARRSRLVAAMIASVLIAGLGLAATPALAVAPEAPSLEVYARKATAIDLSGVLYPYTGPAGEPGSYEFLYKQSASECQGASKTEPRVATGLQGEEVFKILSGLLSGKQYTVCLAVTGPGGTTLSSPVTVSTAIMLEAPTGLKAESVAGSTATLAGVLNPLLGRKTEPGSYEFLYRKSGSECEGESSTSAVVAAGGLAEAVSVPVSGLDGLTTYAFCLRARNEAGETIVSAPSTFTTSTAAPRIDQEWATNVTATGAELHTQIDPGGAATTYRFEYGPTVAYGTSIPTEGEAGAGTQDASFGVQLQNLVAGTVYHYRVFATNAVAPGGVAGEDHTFTTQPSGSEFALPDGRQYELVSPPNKYGTEARGLASYNSAGVAQAAEDGNAVTYTMPSPPIPYPPSNDFGAQIFSTRGPAGWSSQDIVVPYEESTGYTNAGGEYKAFSTNLNSGLLVPYNSTTPLGGNPPHEWATPYLHDNLRGTFEPLLTQSEIPATMNPEWPTVNEPRSLLEVQGMSADGSHVVFASRVPLTPGATGLPDHGATTNLYEYSNGELQLASILEDGAPAAGLAGLGSGKGKEGGGGSRDPVSTNGSRLVWTYELNTMLLRDMQIKQTIQVDASDGGPESGQGIFRIANSDASHVFFTDTKRLTGSTSPFAEKNNPFPHDTNTSEDLYVFEDGVSNGKLHGHLVDLTPDHNPGDRSAADVLGVLGDSSDGSYVYYVATGTLAPGARSGLPNLYFAHYSGGKWGSPVFIATLSFEDVETFDEKNGGGIDGMTPRVAPNGRYLTFMSQAPITGYDNRDAVTGQRDAEVYLFDSAQPVATGNPICVSCNPTGARPVGEEPGHHPNEMDPQVAVHQPVAAMTPPWEEYQVGSSMYQPRFLSDNGRLFFDSVDALVPQDVNGKPDVYEYEPGGVGSCVQSGGCVYLISSGVGSSVSTFVDASASGDDVFFVTRDQLVPEDFDHAYDMYDAHVCSEAAACFAPRSAVPPPCSSGDGCKPAPLPQPAVFGLPASATFSGAGNASGGVISQSQSRSAKTVKHHSRRGHRRRRSRRAHSVRSRRAKTGKGR